MKKTGILLMLICATCLCLGQLVWKLMPGFNLIYMIGGLIIYVIGGLSMILAYRHGELSVLQPINSTSYVFSSIIGVFILHESLSVVNIVGISLIIVGVINIGVSSR